MRISRMNGLGVLLAATMLAGCNNVQEENALLMEENEGLRSQLAQRNLALDEANRELRDKSMQVAQLRRDLDASQQAPDAGATGFEGIRGVEAAYGAGEVTAIVESDILFDSGKATLKAAAKRSLDQVASVLNSSYAGKTIRIAGHTDTDPIRKSGHKSNYHLGFERGYSVRDYLTSRGVSASRMYLASYGPDVPRGSKSQSRRVEITVILN